MWCVVREGVSVGRLFLEGCPEVPTRCFKPLAGVLEHHEHRESTFGDSDAGLPKMGVLARVRGRFFAMVSAEKPLAGA